MTAYRNREFFLADPGGRGKEGKKETISRSLRRGENLGGTAPRKMKVALSSGKRGEKRKRSF